MLLASPLQIDELIQVFKHLLTILFSPPTIKAKPFRVRLPYWDAFVIKANFPLSSPEERRAEQLPQ